MENVFPLHQGLDLVVKFFLIIYPRILKPKNKKTKQTPAQRKVQHSLDDWLNKGVKEATVRFNEKVTLRILPKNGNISEGRKILDLNWVGYHEKHSFHVETTRTKRSHATKASSETRTQWQSRMLSDSHSENHAQGEHPPEIRTFHHLFIDDEKKFHEVPPLVEKGEQVQVQELEEGEIFDHDKVLAGLTQHGEQEPPPNTPPLKPLRNPSPPCPVPPNQGHTKTLHDFPVHSSEAS